MPSDITGLRRDRAKASTRMNELATAARGRSMTDDEQRDFDACDRDIASLDAQIASAEADADTAARAAAAAAEAGRNGTNIARAEAAEIAKLCVDGGVPTMTASLLAEGVTLADAKVRIGAAGQIKDLVALAGRASSDIKADLADTFIAEGKTVEQARAALFDKLVAKQDQNPVNSHVPPSTTDRSTKIAATSSMQRELERSGLVKKGA